ncbi:hypothetical protein [Anaeromicrobium sediminis]|uniref:Uncharacterized protein n=1 Tax=Anaeromicrobium sediminis TaxID=1478221 RepID=A0A267MNP2_9FIRM|nr:hypothetical protein [Anaeromicrobium sediminis]PAB61022.1 hypothetical protein CCE28_00910 [Anaeromicrobium sediminis]
MNLEDTIRACMKKYPRLFLDRWEVLNYLFCTLHCDHKWKDGELVGTIDTIYKQDTPLFAEQIIELIKFREKLWGQAFYIYPLGKKYSNLFNFPKNIKTDWLKGIIETIKFILLNMNENDDVYMEVSKGELEEYYLDTLNNYNKFLN